MSDETTSQAALIWCPFANESEARSALSTLLAERLVACGNIIPDMQSVFVWEGEEGRGSECGVLFKTVAARLDAAMARLEDIHPYETPAITGWTVRASAGTLAWLVSQTQNGENEEV